METTKFEDMWKETYNIFNILSIFVMTLKYFDIKIQCTTV